MNRRTKSTTNKFESWVSEYQSSEISIGIRDEDNEF